MAQEALGFVRKRAWNRRTGVAACVGKRAGGVLGRPMESACDLGW